MSSGAGGSNSAGPSGGAGGDGGRGAVGFGFGSSNSSSATKLELSVSPQDGSLLVAPLSTVVGAAADSLYSDLHAMTYKEITIAVPKATPATLAPGDGEEEDEEEGGGANDTDGRADDVGAGEDGGAHGGVVPTRTAKMASLSFAQRRHELASRVAQHSRSIAHVAALVSWYCAGGTDPAGSLPSSSSPRYNNSGGSSPMYNANKRARLSHSGSAATSSNEAADIVKVSSEALRHVRESWVQADEAQDALFFHHAELWKGRRHVHDILGAMSILSAAPSQTPSDPSPPASSDAGSWTDFPTDVTLIVDRYEHSIERTWSRTEALQRLRCAVRWKLFMGELGHSRSLHSSLGTLGQGTEALAAAAASLMPWRVELESDGGAIRVTYGTPRPRRTTEGGTHSDADLNGDGDANSSPSDGSNKFKQKRRNQQLLYPIEARLTVLSDSPSTAEWTLLSVLVNVSAKTGESNHQLELSKKQMFDLHRICVRAMAVEEAQCRKANDAIRNSKKETPGETQKQSSESGPIPDENDVVMKDSTTMNGTSNVQKEPSSLNLNGPWKRPDGTVIPRPLDCLFDVTHTFAISLQLEILSSQAEALRRGSWGGKKGGTSGGADGSDTSSCISVSPVHFFDRDDPLQPKDSGASRTDKPIGVMAIHFWSVDDRHGSPKMGVLSLDDDDDRTGDEDGALVKKESDVNSRHEDAASRSSATSSRLVPQFRQRRTKRLTLSIRATPRLGITVAMSGGESILSSISSQLETSPSSSTASSDAHIRRSLEKLLSYIQNPFELSASDALLAATVICAERRCIAVVSALQAASARSGDNASTTTTKKAGQVLLPGWIHLGVECGTITVAIRVTYDGDDEASIGSTEKPPVVAFGLACDSRTGKFVTVFPRAATLLRSLACNDLTASEVQLLRHAAATQNMSAALLRRRGGRPAAAVAGGRDSTGRIVREAFEGLTRSMDLLGLRVGVGGDWVDVDASTSASLRGRAVEVACADARSSLMTCAGMAAVYGFTALALGTCTGVDAVVDMAGGPITEGIGVGTPIQSPPIATVLSQEVVEKIVSASGDETKKTTLLQRELFAALAVVHDDALRIFWYDVTTQVDSPSSVPSRISLSRVSVGDGTADDDFAPSEAPSATVASLQHEVQNLAARLHKYLGD